MYSLLCQYAKIGPNAELYAAQERSDMQLENYTKAQTLGRKNRTIEFFESSRKARKLLFVVVIIGACMVFGDGVLTPAISGVGPFSPVQLTVPFLLLAGNDLWCRPWSLFNE